VGLTAEGIANKARSLLKKKTKSASRSVSFVRRVTS